jgi:hypothetical protein
VVRHCPARRTSSRHRLLTNAGVLGVGWRGVLAPALSASLDAQGRLQPSLEPALRPDARLNAWRGARRAWLQPRVRSAVRSVGEHLPLSRVEVARPAQIAPRHVESCGDLAVSACLPRGTYGMRWDGMGRDGPREGCGERVPRRRAVGCCASRRTCHVARMGWDGMGWDEMR